jgi:hypothetical protein
MQKFSETIYKGFKSVNNSAALKYLMIVVGLYCAVFFSVIIANSNFQTNRLEILLLLIVLSFYCAMINIIELVKNKKTEKKIT